MSRIRMGGLRPTGRGRPVERMRDADAIVLERSQFLIRRHLVILKRVAAHQTPHAGERRARHRRHLHLGTPLPPLRFDGAIDVLRAPALGITGGEEGAEGGHAVGHDGDAGFHFAPEEDPDHVVLAVAEFVAGGAEDVADDAEDGEAEEGAETEFPAGVDADGPEEEDGDRDYWGEVSRPAWWVCR